MKKIFSILFVVALVLAFSLVAVPATPVAAAGPFTLPGGSLTTTNTDSWGQTSYSYGVHFNVDAGPVTIEYLGVSAYPINYTGDFGWPPDSTDTGASVIVGLQGGVNLVQYSFKSNMGGSRPRGTDPETYGKGSWNHQTTGYWNDDGYRSYLFQGQYTGNMVATVGNSQYNAEKHGGPAGDDPDYDTFDFKFYVEKVGPNAYNVTGWHNLWLSSAQDEGCGWDWNYAKNAINPAKRGYLKCYEGTWTADGGLDLSDVQVFLAIQNWAGTQPGPHTFNWDSVVVTGTVIPSDEVWVDDDYYDGGANDGHTWGYDAFDNIQDAINAVAGSTVYVAAGTYIQAGQIVIAKNLTIIGADRDTTIIKRGPSFSGSYFFRVNAGNFNLSNVTLDGDGNLYGGVRYGAPGTGTISNNIFRNITSSGYTGFGVVAYSDSVSVSNNIFTNIGRVGIWVGGDNVLVTGNTYTGKGAIDCLDYGIEVGMGGVATITSNTITNCKGVASDNSTSAGILVTTYYGAGTTATVTGNTLIDNTGAIAVGYDGSDTSTVIAHYNDISGNTDYGIDTTAPFVDATANWWGDASGPYNATTNPSGTGDSVSDNIDYSPWWGANYIGIAHPWNWHTNDFIQEAVDDASAGDTVNVLAGTYQESKGGWRDIEVVKSLSIIGAGSGQTIVELSGLQHGVELRPDITGVLLIEGMTFTKRALNTKSADWAIIVGETGGTFNSLTFRDVEVAWGQARNLHLCSATYHSIMLENCNIHDGGTWGFSARGTIDSMVVENSHFDSNGWYDSSHGIGFDLDMPHSVASLTVTGGTFNSNTAKGINLVKTSNAAFTDITANNNGGAPGGGFGVCLWEWSGTSENLTFNNPTLRDNDTDGFLIGCEHGMTVRDVTITSGIMTGNGRAGLFVYRASGWGDGVIDNIVINRANINDNTQWGVAAIMAYEHIDARYNWWGSSSGPYHATDNPSGTGDKVSDEVDFYPWLIVENPTVTTQVATGITVNTATLNMNFTVGGYGSVNVRFAYKKSADSTWSYTSWAPKSASGTHTASAIGLSSNTQYDFRAQLKYNDVEFGETTFEGTTFQFTTLRAPPTVTTQAATGLSYFSATLNMGYTVGDFSPVQVRFAYKKATATEWHYTAWVSKSADGSHSEILGLLQAGSSYQFEAQLQYDSTSIEGAILQFTTTAPPPWGAGGCFIATAAYGTSTAPQLDLLREFRDVVLLQSTVGSQFVSLYYRLSPPIADFMAGHEAVRTLIREILIDPIVWLVDATGGSWRN